MEISRNLSKQPFSTASGRITVKNSLRDYFHLLKSSEFMLLVLKYAASYSWLFTVFGSFILSVSTKSERVQNLACCKHSILKTNYPSSRTMPTQLLFV